MDIDSLGPLERVDCLLCGCNQTRTVTSQKWFGEEFFIVRCVKCGLIHVHPDPPAADLEEIYSSEDYLDRLFDNPKWRTWVVSNHWHPVLKAIEDRIG